MRSNPIKFWISRNVKSNLWWGAYQPVFIRIALMIHNAMVVAEGIYQVDTLAVVPLFTNLISTSFAVYCLSGRVLYPTFAKYLNLLFAI